MHVGNISSDNNTTNVTFFGKLDDQWQWGLPILTTVSVVGLIGGCFVYRAFYRCQDFWNNPTYRLMFSMGVNDGIGLITALVGYLLSFSSISINIQMIVGMLSQLNWFNVSSHLLIVGINRVVTMLFPTIRQTLFNQRTTVAWIGLAWLFGISHSLVLMPGLPVAFRVLVWDINKCGLQFILVNPEGFGMPWFFPYDVIWHIGVAIALVIMYSLILCKIRGTVNSSKQQQLLCLQMGIVSLNFCVAIVLFSGLAAFQFLRFENTSKCFGDYLLQISWFLNMALNPFVYLLVNKRLRIYVRSNMLQVRAYLINMRSTSEGLRRSASNDNK